ncbi:MAG: SAM-dependent methyltransferase [Bacteroidia bacterium]|nr:SAM-dependent methyltransferase [Bacteroidia bacterium]
MNGKLYLIPSPLSDGEITDVIPSSVLRLLPTLDCFVVEEVRTARRYLSRAGLKGHIDSLEFHLLNEHSTPADAEALAGLFADGRDVGLISEAGLPAVADPGAMLVEVCHRRGIRVVPLTGPSSLMLALMASGLNGQSFAFCGYLPAKAEQRRAAIRNIEKTSARLRQSQIFIETPYRNDAMLSDLLESCLDSTELCIAADITSEGEYIRTLSIARWKKEKTEIGKRPCVFILLAK